jgi:oligoribonuclease NrnB/cAMP/cGMP phosphodiesterase (DHH superfamily)
MGILDFSKYLIDINKATQEERTKELWDLEGILKDRLNQKLKFDLRPLKNDSKIGSFKTKADKMVFDIKNQYIIVDIEELHLYLKKNNVKKVYLESLISELDWNIILPKN